MDGSGWPSGRDDGLTLVELLVALLVLGVVMAGLASVTISTLRVTQVNDSRSVATNLAQAELERILALPFSELTVGGRETRTVDREGTSYEVVRDTVWVDLEADTDPCAEGTGSTDEAMVRVDVAVRQVGLEDHEVTSTTTLASPPVSESNDRGALSVQVNDHQDPSAPVANVWVTATGPTEFTGASRTLITPATGCVLFTDLEPGSYEVEVARAGYVSIGGVPEPVSDTGVSAASRATMEFSYAPAGGLVLDAAARAGLDGVLPVEVPVTAARAQLTSQGLRGQTIDPIRPGLWEVWAGDCPAADPLGIDVEGDAIWPGAVRQDRVAVPAAGTATAVGDLGVARMVVTGALSNPADPQQVTITAEAVGDCEGGTPTLTWGPLVPSSYSGNAGNIDIALPYGTWQVTATNGAASMTSYAVVDPRDDSVTAVQPTPPGGGG